LINSCTDFTGKEGLTAKIQGVEATRLHGREVLRDVVGKPVKIWRHHERRSTDHDRIAVGRRPRDRLGSERAAGARPFLDDNLLSQVLGDLLPQSARHCFRSTQRYEADWFDRILLRDGSRANKTQNRPYRQDKVH
jgi:hypothetical protein